MMEVGLWCLPYAEVHGILRVLCCNNAEGKLSWVALVPH